MKPEGSLPHTQVPATCPYESARSSPYLHIPLLNIILPSTPGFPQWSLYTMQFGRQGNQTKLLIHYD